MTLPSNAPSTMKQASRRRFAPCLIGSSLWLLLLISLAGCGPERPRPIADGSFEPTAEERELWEKAAALESRLEGSPLVERNQAIEDYIGAIAARLLPHMGSSPHEIRTRILADPFINAAALPNGAIYFHAGTFVGVETEAQLALIVGHELAHYVERHSLRFQLTAAYRRDVGKIVTRVLGTIALVGGQPLIAMDLFRYEDKVGTILDPQVLGYSRDLESSADQVAVTALHRAGYDLEDAIKVFDTLGAELPADEIAEPYYLGSHPTREERRESCRELASRKPLVTDVVTNVGDFDTIVAPMRLRSARLDLAIGRVTRAQHAIEQYLRTHPDSSEGHLVLGMVHERRGDDLAEQRAALAAFESAVRLDPNSAPAHRALGLAYRTVGNDELARQHLARFLEIEPGAADAAILRTYLGAIP